MNKALIDDINYKYDEYLYHLFTFMFKKNIKCNKNIFILIFKLMMFWYESVSFACFFFFLLLCYFRIYFCFRIDRLEMPKSFVVQLNSIINDFVSFLSSSELFNKDFFLLQLFIILKKSVDLMKDMLR